MGAFGGKEIRLSLHNISNVGLDKPHRSAMPS